MARRHNKHNTPFFTSGARLTSEHVDHLVGVGVHLHRVLLEAAQPNVLVSFRSAGFFAAAAAAADAAVAAAVWIVAAVVAVAVAAVVACALGTLAGIVHGGGGRRRRQMMVACWCHGVLGVVDVHCYTEFLSTHATQSRAGTRGAPVARRRESRDPQLARAQHRTLRQRLLVC